MINYHPLRKLLCGFTLANVRNLMKNIFKLYRYKFFIILFIYLLFKATPVAYGISQVRDLIGGAAAGTDHNHSNTTATATITPVLIHVCDLYHSSRQY